MPVYTTLYPNAEVNSLSEDESAWPSIISRPSMATTQILSRKKNMMLTSKQEARNFPVRSSKDKPRMEIKVDRREDIRFFVPHPIPGLLRTVRRLIMRIRCPCPYYRCKKTREYIAADEIARGGRAAAEEIGCLMIGDSKPDKKEEVESSVCGLSRGGNKKGGKVRR
jgi:hypothetical protein